MRTTANTKHLYSPTRVVSSHNWQTRNSDEPVLSILYYSVF